MMAVMSVLKTILGGIVVLCVAAPLSAAPRDRDPAPSAPTAPEARVAPEIAPEARFSTMGLVAPPGIVPLRPPGQMHDWRPSVRPLSRADGVALALAGHRPEARPLAMVRYPVTVQTGATLRPVARHNLPETRWDRRQDAETWTRAVLAAINGQSHDLSDVVPRDIDHWCPAYAGNSAALRDDFWVGMMSALARHESTLDPRAVGGGGLWYGLLQIYPPTARHFGCAATTGEELLNPVANLACAARIMTVTVRRDQAVALHDGRWRGVAADWGPMTEPAKREEMAAWTRAQDYCVIRHPQVRPVARPADLAVPAAVVAPGTAVAAPLPPRPWARPWDDGPVVAPGVAL